MGDKITEKEKDNKSNPWLDAHYNPVASLYTFTSCIALADLHADGENKLVVADLGTGTYNMKLKVYKGTSLMTESSIIDLPTAVVTFHMDMNEPKTPAIAVASGPFIYIYKNLRPYFKFSLPLEEVNPVENDIWNQAKEDRINVSVMRDMLSSLREELGVSVLTVRSLKFLQLPPEEVEPFAAVHKHTPLKKQSVVTCMDTLRKTSNDEGSISCLVVGAENKDICILDPEAFTVLSKVSIPSVPVFMAVSGLFDVDYRIMIACRNSKIYHLKKGNDPARLVVELPSPIVGLERVGKNIVVGCMDQTITSFSSKGKKLWAVHLPDIITTMTLLNHKAKGYKALLVALNNGEVRVYRDKSLCNVINAQDVVTGMRYGRFGREDGALVMATKGGGLIVKILKRTAQFENMHMGSGVPAAQLAKINVPRKTKLFVDQALREREHSQAMHQVFQTDLFKLRLNTARSFVKTLETRMNPISSTLDDPLKLSAQVLGLGPTFQIMILLSNTSADIPSKDLLITFSADNALYKIQHPVIEVPFVLPGGVFNYNTLVEAISDKGIADKIKVYLLHKEQSIPIITAIISMPVSEGIIME
ncbi:Bardet-Biedl syndrome 1 protein homolog [Hydractinia symbiolongicarpus]|uniref:Bardet-Biedl syndrome 1 protein homolog n=1 Tax=Hydractinia symbiolongicarpus TaxID=13093 RepID=UPI00254C56E0|nr:Bardet-Biedl syndrome 1 protein homolog [Hydractinia symbiolongicarpus]